MKVYMEQGILQENARQAEENRALFGKTLVVNLIGSPGCGKTTLLEKTLAALGKEFRMAVIEGDIYTTKDAQRIEACGVPVVQVNTAGGCHLSAEITARGGHLITRRRKAVSPRAYMIFSDFDAARGLFDGTLEAMSALAAGKIIMKGYIPMIDNLNRVLNRVPVYLQ